MASSTAIQNLAAAFEQAGAVAGLAPQLSALDRADQNSPETLNGRLAYAEHLVQGADRDCRKRVDAAQGQLKIVVSKPAFFVVMPLGAARAADIEYGIHATLAACSTEASVRDSEFRAAREAALRAADLYRDGFDYPSMAVMQFAAAVADRQLGDQANAAAMLQTAIEMDKANGFQEDAEDNEALLQRWSGDGSSPRRCAEPNKDADQNTIVPSRSAALKFAWSSREADVAVAASYVTVLDTKIVHSQAAATRTLSIRDGHPGWVMSFPQPLERTTSVNGPKAARNHRSWPRFSWLTFNWPVRGFVSAARETSNRSSIPARSRHRCRPRPPC